MTTMYPDRELREANGKLSPSQRLVVTLAGSSLYRRRWMARLKAEHADCSEEEFRQIVIDIRLGEDEIDPAEESFANEFIRHAVLSVAGLDSNRRVAAIWAEDFGVAAELEKVVTEMRLPAVVNGGWKLLASR